MSRDLYCLSRHWTIYSQRWSEGTGCSRFNARRELVERVQGLRFQVGAEEPKRKRRNRKMKLTLESASLIVDKALAKAREAKFRPMCVAVLDDGGHVKVLKREDGASILRPNIAIGKAWGAGGMGESSRQLGERLKERPAFLGALSDMSGGKVV